MAENKTWLQRDFEDDKSEEAVCKNVPSIEHQYPVVIQMEVYLGMLEFHGEDMSLMSAMILQVN